MIDENVADIAAALAPGRRGFDVNWTRVEGVAGGGALLTSFVWFLGMPTGMAFGVGFGLVLLLDFVRALIFDTPWTDRSELDAPAVARH